MSRDQPTPAILDVAHLRRQTLEDRALERELLALFDDQCTRLVPVIAARGSSGLRAEAAHTLKGAARAIGAGRIADLTERLESMFDAQAADTLAAPLTHELERAVAEFRHTIARDGHATT